MNRREIIKWLRSLKAEIGRPERMSLWHYEEAIDRAIEALQERPKGAWIIHGEPPIYVRECPECGAKYHYAKEWGEVNYCSNCGADCRGDIENE